MNKLTLGILLLTLTLGACGNKTADKKGADKKSGPVATPVTVTSVSVGSMLLLEESVGVLESLADPIIAAETAGKLLEVRAVAGNSVKTGQVLAVLDAQDAGLAKQSAQAEMQRVKTLQENQTKALARQRQLHDTGFISQGAFDDARTQMNVVNNQLVAAKSQLAIAERNVAKTKIVAPFDGRIEKQIAVAGQYVKVGDPLFQLVGIGKLRARLPFPESLAAKLTPGMRVNLTTFIDERIVSGMIESVRPMTGINNRSFEVLVIINEPGMWRPGSTVSGQVVMDEHRNAVLVPQHSVVLRPIGKVVYVLEGDKVKQQTVKVGAIKDGQAEIISGLSGTETIVVDGAGFLTDQANVTVASQYVDPGQAVSAVVPASAK
ncbi:MAG: efflux RND transporter periplasmic adaptor subunit [Gallionellaceae bacterium]|jgi:RND family efflux transporter MFP subunit